MCGTGVWNGSVEREMCGTGETAKPETAKPCKLPTCTINSSAEGCFTPAPPPPPPPPAAPAPPPSAPDAADDDACALAAAASDPSACSSGMDEQNSMLGFGRTGRALDEDKWGPQMRAQLSSLTGTTYNTRKLKAHLLLSQAGVGGRVGIVWQQRERAVALKLGDEGSEEVVLACGGFQRSGFRRRGGAGS